MKKEIALPNCRPDRARATVPVTIETEHNSYKVDVAAGDLILHEALRAGVPLAYSCASGTCGTCVAQVMEGALENRWPDAPGLSARMRQGGRVLLCQSAAFVPTRLRTAESAVNRHGPLHTPDYCSAHVLNKSWLAPGVTELQLQLDRGLLFTPGQFILVWFQGLNGPRALSISNTDHSPVDQVRLLAKPRKGSELDALLGSDSVIGMPLRLFGPLGSACLEDGAAYDDITCIAGSTGIAPMLPIMFEWARQGAPGSMQLIYAARTREDVFLLEEIEHIVKRSGGHLKAIIALSEPRNDDVDVLREQVRDFAQVFAGYAHDAVRELASAKPLGGIAFVSGSKPMVQATVKALILHGKLSPTAIRSDDFC
ncbi:2Fe-2S iron-sulfur cluster-binding protein [Pusillimonas minor]|uniref:2Fe-2S iron-sulfur cluster binding domain-containing protein n=1 Tax=Pusillimonas minor TaxID=2697024 RepID=A0A842HTW5_9BURK|nr:2Fe-2S iron-sulfur cluster binding domain-containing protein [Pusillimonas minor]MBC2771078.1 2Fe-2S iron-sulfur cluster binding domain-containing protein [Pusillimonas minor]MCK9468975.1 2Fe-2S iron-sulfur cluster binding domain-containing protein [Porticoccaceae bacterium]|tara:strand:+ start:12865 stop:13971 length:1107 start_codon:yes stop_codon:yes gene_type:complete